MKTIRASDIGTYLYCHRAWWYGMRGVASQNSAELSAGTAIHRGHGRRVFMAGALRTLALVLLLAALALLAAYCTSRLV
jgi:CRISPR/Cas system-associated exonuclease Cas4 (RecB family)